MKKQLIAAGLVAALAFGAVGMASATTINLVVNGDFSQTTDGTNTPTQFGSQSAYGFTSTQFITGWTGNDGYQMWYPNATDAVGVNAHSAWGQGSNHDTGKEMLWGPIAAPPNGTLTFIGMDGDQANGPNGNQVQGSIGQLLGGLTAGARYTVSFDWAAAQMQSRSGETQTNLKVSFGDQSLSTDPLDNPGHGFTGWVSGSFQFVADSDSAWLSFLSVGTPSGLPPVALLTNVSVTRNVPEPSELGLFGAGLLGLGLLTLAARRRALQRKGAGSAGDMS